MTHILGIGVATVDIINTTVGYPNEDDEIRALTQSIRRGGNVCNTLTVLSQLGHRCEWCGTYSNDTNATIITNELSKYTIEYQNSLALGNTTTPTSYITLNQENGSRTIVHYRNLPELQCDQFTKANLSKLNWCHFEGRNVGETRKMLNHLRQHYPTLPYSVEIEKPRQDIKLLFAGASILFFSKHYATENGYSNATDLLNSIVTDQQNTLLVCMWGSDGAYALYNNQMIFQPAIPIKTVIDTIGAGDTFIAGFLNQWWQSANINLALQDAATIASRKCHQIGYDNLGP